MANGPAHASVAALVSRSQFGQGGIRLHPPYFEFWLRK
jgi:hypothetical protein